MAHSLREKSHNCQAAEGQAACFGGYAWWTPSCPPGRSYPSPSSPRPWRTRGSPSATLQELNCGGLEDGHDWRERHFEWLQVRFEQGSPGLDRLDPRITKKTMKHLCRLMAWGCFIWKQRGILEWPENRDMMNRVRYRWTWTRARVVHDAAGKNPLPAWWHPMPQV
jgi:hypothetical protein